MHENFRAALPAALRVSGEGSVLSFPSGKERKNQRKENLSGWEMRANHRAALPAAFVSRLSGGRPGLRYPFSPAGLFFQKSPANIFAGNVRSADGRAQRANPSGFPAFFSGSLFFLRKEKRTEEKPRKIFLRANQTPPTGGRSGCFRGGFPAFFSGSLFFLLKEKRTEEKPRKYFCGECAFRRRAGAAGQPKRVPGFLFWFSFLSPERKENETEQNK